MRGLSPVVASGGHSSSRCAGLSLSQPLLLRSTGSRRAGSVIVAHGSSCSTACGIFPDRGSNPCPLHWQADSQPLRHQGSPHSYIFNSVILGCNYAYLKLWYLLLIVHQFSHPQTELEFILSHEVITFSIMSDIYVLSEKKNHDKDSKKRYLVWVGMNTHFKLLRWTSLVVQWLRIRLPTQGMWVWSLVGELRSHGPSHNYWVRVLWSPCATTREKRAP